ncbi:bile acid:sodium symporter family protein [Streptococcus mutans]|uniref:bile acid:sodium symporter family protein n=1 Tax=Streptococcus mutans TaxID=1309 RepID=UPI001CFDE1DF|nr:bile acid:sodium symporter family protein [Streptococcus mutans]MCB4998796.1 bile acid:sodium symporter family protein [Streptococcus mutans]MCB5083819.1 bile acid:sodium symporter family protein [Streptococcus mutans]MCB5090042.1 bile acid:sodium symporter family protein [Streptococcus mutans]MCB5131237.1 bile acid:sodium symporter family protein [Streptococcus mutans]
MESLTQFSKKLSKWFTLVVVIWAVFNYFLPTTSRWVIPNTSYLLGIILFGMGLTLTTEDFVRISKRPVPVALGTVAHYVIMPSLAWLLCLIFHLKGATAAGVILVGSCPSGTSSSVMAFLSGGDVALDVSIEILSTLLAPVMLPLLLSVLAGQYIAVPALSLFLSTLRIVVVPIILGVLIHTFFGKKIAAVIKLMPLISQVAILLIIGAVVSANHANIFTAATASVIPVVMLHNLCGYSLGYAFAKLLHLEEPQQKAITFEVGMQDSSLGATLAMKYFVPQAAIPSTIFSIWHNISGSILSSWWKNHSQSHLTERK